MRKERISTFFTFLLVAYPILYIYRSPIATLSLADFLLIIVDCSLLLYSIKYGSKVTKISIPIAIFCYYSIVQMFILLFINYEQFMKIIMPSFRIMLYIASIGLFGKEYIDIKYAKKVLKILVLLSSLYLVLQLLILKIFHFYLPGTIPFIPKYDQNLATFELYMRNNYLHSYRVRSLFIEPSHYAIYASLGLVVMLNEKNKKYGEIVFLILSMILSGSSTAILMVPISLLMYFIININHVTPKKIFRIMIISVLLLVTTTIYMKTENFQKFYDRTFGYGSATTNRIGNYSLIFNNNDTNDIFKFFGHGIYKIEEYIPSIPRVYYYYGIIGFIVFWIVSVFCLIKYNKNRKTVLANLLIMSFTSELLFSHFIIPFLVFITKDEKFDYEL